MQCDLDCRLSNFVWMKALKPVIFVVPIFALIIVIILYINSLKKVTDRRQFKQFILILIVFAFLLNFAWETIQMPLFKAMKNDIQSTVFCALATVADVIMVLLLYFGFAVMHKDPIWIQDLKGQRILALILFGGVGAIFAELRHLKAGTWSYSQSMPIMPFVKVGLSPVLQFMVLPTLIYYLSFLKRKRILK